MDQNRTKKSNSMIATVAMTLLMGIMSACAILPGDQQGNSADLGPTCGNDDGGANFASDVNNCGSCGHVCRGANATMQCVDGQCALDACSAGFGDCDGDAANGCEARITTAQNCGQCGIICGNNNGHATCVAGACSVVCNPGFADCNKNPIDGCEVDLNASTHNCGACGTVCPGITNGVPVCNGGACDVACNNGLTLCNGACVDVQNDNANCGLCNRACRNTFECAQGKCACPNGQMDCSGTCINALTDPNNCGACGNACAQGLVCGNGACTKICPQGQTKCGFSCYDTTTDKSNCGACGKVCNLANVAIQSCVLGMCAVNGSCNKPFRDCDLNPQNGCEVNTDTDLTNCGACGHQCPGGLGINGTRNCVAGGCGLVCTPGFGDCNNNADDGCEANLNLDAGNCGGCGLACKLANGVGGCQNGTCFAKSCNKGFGDCNFDPADGCESNITNDRFNCGACGVACNGNAKSCVNSKCVASCNNNLQDGNETDVDCGGTDCPKCGIPKHCLLGSDCLSTSCFNGLCQAAPTCNDHKKNGNETDIDCGGTDCPACDIGKGCIKQDDCVAAPHATKACTNGICQLGPCGVNYADCNGFQSDGCEVNLVSDDQNCGKCGNRCNRAHTSMFCTGGACAVDSCDTGFADCNNLALDGCEADLNNNANNCGACANVCRANNAVASCAKAMCGVGCNNGFADCDKNANNGCEANLNTDPNNCGVCGTVCKAVPNGVGNCTNGVCGVATCNPGFADCNNSLNDGCEVNLGNDAKNCGKCAVVCGNNQSCNAGVCGLNNCGVGLADCDGNGNNGCEVTLATDPNNCGACANKCTVANGTPVCTNGVCKVSSCSNGYADCDGDPKNGCEVNLNTDAKNCGKCAVVCGNNQSCVAQVCGQISCGNAVKDGSETDVDCGGSCVAQGKTCQNGKACLIGADCQSGICTGGVCVACGKDADCPKGFFCGAGSCYDNTDLHGRTGELESGLNGGPWADGHPDNWDWDGDCYCAVAPCRGSNNNACGLLKGGDCDDTGDGWMGKNNSGFGNNPGAVDYCVDKFDNNCNGVVNDPDSCGCPMAQVACSNVCRDLTADNANCGACGTVCPMGKTCQAGACK